MFLGTKSVERKIYADKYLPGVGTVSSFAQMILEDHVCYECENCGYQVSFPAQFKAEEKFYCRQCQHEIGID